MYTMLQIQSRDKAMQNMLGRKEMVAVKFSKGMRPWEAAIDNK